MHRIERIQTLIASTVGQLIVSKEIKDPRVCSLASVSRVQVSKDLGYAKIFISGYLESRQLENAVDGLNSAAGFIQARLGAVLKTRRTPRVQFFADNSIAEGFQLFDKIKTD
ncbi:MAG: 30S ribosome-binding factor RbfA [Spirochaetaceae bacterium]|nr:MAG: 30S ribosome-binding factor RbfA [Spirochaetaceae bacterium]